MEVQTAPEVPAGVTNDFYNKQKTVIPRNNCFREKSYKENLLWQARYVTLCRHHHHTSPSSSRTVITIHHHMDIITTTTTMLTTTTTSRYSGNNHLLNKAHSYPTPSCGSLEKIYASAG